MFQSYDVDTHVKLLIVIQSLRLSNAAKKMSTIGEIVNLMSVDAQKIQDAPGYMHMIWSTPFTIALATYFLWQQLGPSVLAGVAIMFLLMPLNALVAAKTRKLQVKMFNKF
jgi:ATP-binding cassette subfamily C (CFTR/MRP) protein 1